MKIRLLSDLHTEFRLPYKTHAMSKYCGEKVLVLAGDIASGSKNTVDVIKFFKDLGFPHVVYVPGNHEYYGTSVQDFDNKMREKCAKLNGVHFLNGDSVNIDGVQFVGGTLWTNFGNNPLNIMVAKRMISDFRVINDFTPEKAMKMFYDQFDYINFKYETRIKDQKTVVITHFLPAQQCISPRYRNDTSGLNDYFANHLDNYIAELQDTTWLFGHTHDPVDIKIGNTRVVANPHGYYTAMDEGHNFEPFKTIEL